MEENEGYKRWLEERIKVFKSEMSKMGRFEIPRHIQAAIKERDRHERGRFRREDRKVKGGIQTNNGGDNKNSST